MDDPAQHLVGRRIVAVECDKYVRLELDDETAVVFVGGGYDGLWDDTYVEWDKKPRPVA